MKEANGKAIVRLGGWAAFDLTTIFGEAIDGPPLDFSVRGVYPFPVWGLSGSIFLRFFGLVGGAIVG